MHFTLETNLTKQYRQKYQRGGLGSDPPAAGGKRGFGGGSPDAEKIFTLFSKKYAYLSILCL